MSLEAEAAMVAAGVAWVECPDCEDYWCRIHGEHVYECPCPSVDEWVEDDMNPDESEG